MTAQQLERISELRRENYSYQFIGDTLGMPMNTVKSICRRQGFEANGPRKTKVEKQNAPLCLQCHKLLDGQKKMFCSDYCRVKWRRNNRKVIEVRP